MRAELTDDRAPWMGRDFECGVVSVIVPTYNRARLVLEALESVRAQTYRPLEVVVVDDGSTDDTAGAVRQFAARTRGDVDVRLVRQERRGAQIARNRGLAGSRGEFIQFLDSDDLLHPDKLSAQVREMRRDPRVDYVFSAWECLRPDGEEQPRQWPDDFSPDLDNLIDLMLFREARLTLPLCTDNGLYRRALCLRVGPWDPEVRRMQPRLYNLRMLLTGARCRYLPAVHAWHRMHSGEQISDHGVEPPYLANMRDTWHKVQRLLEEAGRLSSARRGLLAGCYYATARPALIAGEGRLGMDLLADAIAAEPPWPTGLKLRLTRLLYRVLGLRAANELFDLKLRLAARLGRAVRH